MKKKFPLSGFEPHNFDKTQLRNLSITKYKAGRRVGWLSIETERAKAHSNSQTLVRSFLSPVVMNLLGAGRLRTTQN